MEIKEFRKLVNDSSFKEELNNIEVDLFFEYTNTEFTLKGIQSIYKFVLDQVIGWNKIETNIPYFIPSKIHFENLKNLILEFVSTFNDINQIKYNQYLMDIKNELSKTKTNSKSYIFLFDSPETDFLISVNNKNISYLGGALDYIIGNSISTTNDINYFTGKLLAYEFRHQKDSLINKRRNSEELSLNQIRNKFNEYIVEAEQQLNGYLSDSKDNLISHFEDVIKLKVDKNKEFEDWFNNTQEDFDNFYDLAKENIITNEDLYKEKLRLEAPAKYWNQRALVLKGEGNKYLNWLIGISVIAAILLFTLLMLLGSNYFDAAFNDKIKGIKWSIILITIVSLLAFVIRILSKMTFSSFHLSRDAEEREQLTHFYLALKKDTTIEPEERQLILQSLFSRADTGLLKEDSSPTMPTSIIEKFSNKN